MRYKKHRDIRNAPKKRYQKRLKQQYQKQSEMRYKKHRDIRNAPNKEILERLEIAILETLGNEV